MYLVATTTIIVFAAIGELTMYSALILFVEYLILVLIVWIQEKRKP